MRLEDAGEPSGGTARQWEHNGLGSHHSDCSASELKQGKGGATESCSNANASTSKSTRVVRPTELCL